MSKKINSPLMFVALAGVCLAPTLFAGSAEDAREDARRHERTLENRKHDDDLYRVRKEEEAKRQRRLHPELQIATPFLAAQEQAQ